jgi:hypothetical protein
VWSGAGRAAGAAAREPGAASAWMAARHPPSGPGCGAQPAERAACRASAHAALMTPYTCTLTGRCAESVLAERAAILASGTRAPLLLLYFQIKSLPRLSCSVLRRARLRLGRRLRRRRRRLRLRQPGPAQQRRERAKACQLLKRVRALRCHTVPDVECGRFDSAGGWTLQPVAPICSCSKQVKSKGSARRCVIKYELVGSSSPQCAHQTLGPVANRPSLVSGAVCAPFPSISAVRALPRLRPTRLG